MGAKPLLSKAVNNRKLLKDFFELNAQLKELEKVVKDLRGEIMRIMKPEGPEGETIRYDAIFAGEYSAEITEQTNRYWDVEKLKTHYGNKYLAFETEYKSKTSTFDKLKVKLSKRAS